MITLGRPGATSCSKDVPAPLVGLLDHNRDGQCFAAAPFGLVDAGRLNKALGEGDEAFGVQRLGPRLCGRHDLSTVIGYSVDGELGDVERTGQVHLVAGQTFAS